MQFLWFLEVASIVSVLINFGRIYAMSPVAIFPLSFSCTVEITSHLISDSSQYPPRTRRMKVYYDYNKKRARADLDNSYEAAKLYLRRYDRNIEYMVRFPPISDCKRSYLGELMPYPDISDSVFLNEETIDGQICNHFVHEDFETRVHMFLTVEGKPVKLIQESVIEDQSIEILTYRYLNFSLAAHDESVFELPRTYTHDTCSQHTGGFPYLHIFHYFVRF